jgi:glucosamine--fructose-6-phosphate aminotransferase (isomerizing)
VKLANRMVAGTLMFQEAAAAAGVVRAQLAANAQSLEVLGDVLRRLAPRAVITCARGSSDHAATYAKYLIETRARVLTASAAPSISSLYGIHQDLRQCLFVAISQSGRSPDLLAAVAHARTSGATILALCNDPAAPLATIADHLIDLHAGPEHSVAATKSFLATLTALAAMVAAWTGDAGLQAELRELPEKMAACWRLSWSAAVPLLKRAEHLYVIGRGLGLAGAQEIALKCKETCGLHAEAFSSAELRHGPFALLGPKFPALLLAQGDATDDGVIALAGELAERGVPVLLAGARADGAIALPTVAGSAVLAPVLLVQSAYGLINALAVLRGFDPDRPANLRKITETV